MNISSAFGYIMENRLMIASVSLIVLRLLESIAVATPTEKDNKIVAVVKEFFTLDFFRGK